MKRILFGLLTAIVLAFAVCGVAAEEIAQVFAYEDGVARYANADGKLGLVQESGVILTPAIYDEIGMFDPNGVAFTYRTVDGETYAGLIDRQGTQLVAPDAYVYIGIPYMCDVGYSNRYGVYNALGADGRRYAVFADGSATCLPDQMELGFSRSEFVDNLASFFINGSMFLETADGWRLFDKNAQPLSEVAWEYAKAFPIGGGAVKQGGLWGVVDWQGRLLVAPQYDCILSYTPLGIIVCDTDQEGRDFWGMLSTESGQVCLPLRYDDVFVASEDRLAVCENGQYGYMNSAFEWVVEPRWRWVSDFSDRAALVADESDTYMIDEDGQILIHFQDLNDQDIFWSGVAAVYDDVTNTVTVLNRGGETVQTIENVFISCEAHVADGLLLFAATDAEQAPLGYLSLNTGEIQIAPQWDKAEQFEDGFAIVGRDGACGVIDREGNVVIEPVYSAIWRTEYTDTVYFEALLEHDAGIDYDVFNQYGEVMSHWRASAAD